MAVSTGKIPLKAKEPRVFVTVSISNIGFFENRTTPDPATGLLNAFGTFKTYALPQVKNTGIVLHINNSLKRDSCKVMLSATADIEAMGKTYVLIGQIGGVVCFGAAINFKNGPVMIPINKNLFPTGINPTI